MPERWRPGPPKIDIIDQFKFITAYTWQGCGAPYQLVVELSREPLGEFALIILGLDMQDIVKEWLRPGRERKRKPARHGRKRPHFPPSLDPNDYIASKPRAMAPEYPGLKLPGTKVAFFISDQVDRVNFTAAVVEGAGDVVFETVWGILSVDNSQCPNMPFTNWHRDNQLAFSGVVANGTTMPQEVFDSGQLMAPNGPSAFGCFVSDYQLGWTGKVTNAGSNPLNDWCPAIYSDQRGLVEAGGALNLDPGESVDVAVAASLRKGEIGWPSRYSQGGTVHIDHMQVFGYGSDLW